MNGGALDGVRQEAKFDFRADILMHKILAKRKAQKSLSFAAKTFFESCLVSSHAALQMIGLQVFPRHRICLLQNKPPTHNPHLAIHFG